MQAQQTACEEDLRALQAAQAQRKKAQLYDAKRAAMQAANRENAASAVCARLPREDALAALSQEAAALLALPEQELAAAAPAETTGYLAYSDDGLATASEKVDQIPGQIGMDGREAPTPNIVTFETKKS